MTSISAGGVNYTVSTLDLLNEHECYKQQEGLQVASENQTGKKNKSHFYEERESELFLCECVFLMPFLCFFFVVVYLLVSAF